MRIFLSGGNSKRFILDKKFTDNLNKDKPLLYIPIARNPPYESCIKWIKSIFLDLGIKRIEVLTDLYNRKQGEFKKFSGIYIGGGNTFRLLKLVMDSGFDKVLRKLAEKMPVYGGSAGAIIFGEEIIYSEHVGDPNLVGFEGIHGLNILNECSIWPHYIKKHDKLIKNLSTKRKIIAIPEDSGVIFSGRAFKPVKKNECYVFEMGVKSVLK